MKKILLTIIILLIGMGVFVVIDPLGFQGTYGQRDQVLQTKLVIEKGSVEVNNAAAETGTVLAKGDVVSTGEESRAEIQFFDGSVSRLNAGTTLTLSTLDGTRYLEGTGSIQIDLDEGEVWSNVQQQTGEDFSFGVGTRKVNATVRGTTLNVSDDGETVTVQATEHTTQITDTQDPSTVVDLVEGQQVVLSDEVVTENKDNEDEDNSPKPTPLTLAQNIRAIPTDTKDDLWFTRNERRDYDYETRLKEEQTAKIKEEVGALPGTIGYTIKTAKDSLDLALAKGTDKESLRLAIAERQIMEAQVIAPEKATVAVEQIEKAQKTIQQIQANTSSENIKKRVQQTIQRGKLSVRDALPNDPRYTIKESLREAEINTVSPDRKDAILQKHLQRQTLEAFDLEKEEPNAPEVKAIKQAVEQAAATLNTDVQQVIAPYLNNTPEALEQEVIEISEALEPEVSEEPLDVPTIPSRPRRTPIDPNSINQNTGTQTTSDTPPAAPVVTPPAPTPNKSGFQIDIETSVKTPVQKQPQATPENDLKKQIERDLGLIQ